jgi:3'(2'), 5'-bisphosphate nucleotidase
MGTDLSVLLEAAIHVAVDAGIEILKIYETDFAVEYKSDRSPLTEADKASNQKIIDSLTKFEIPFLSEENEQAKYEIRKNWTYVWIVDPLDGTKEFIKRNGEFTVNIALVKNGKPTLGVIYSPVFRDLYFASETFGSFKIDRHDVIEIFQHPQPKLDLLLQKAKKLPTTKNDKSFTIVASRSHLNSATHQHIEKRKREYTNIELINAGSSIKICFVAEGKANEYPRYGPTMEWDTAAGQAIVELAGKNVIDLETGKPIEYNRQNIKNNSFLVY